MTEVAQRPDVPAPRTLFGHPIGLANLFGVELWGRFSFYGMLTILGYYLYYSVTQGGQQVARLEWWAGALVLAAYAAVLAGFGIWRTLREDVS